MTRIGIILGSTRPNRNGEQVAKWVYEIAARRAKSAIPMIALLEHGGARRITEPQPKPRSARD